MKMAAEVRWLLVFLIIPAFSAVSGELPHRKFEYKYSFKPPYLAQKDGSVPFWSYGGYAFADAENIRVVPSLRSRSGAVWTNQPINFDWWEVDITFRISGRGRIGADGLAFWYTSAKGAFNGTVFGSSDQWNGLGIFFDSFDNDNKHNNPYIMAVLNDGTKVFDHANDGTTQLLAGCLRDFRNKPFATRARIEYYQNVLTLMFHNGMTNNEQDYETCFRAENVFLPKNGYFGISAATGGLADDHDVTHFLTTSLHPPGQLLIDGHKVSTEDQVKLRQEYQDYQKKLEQQKEEYHREHPDERRDKHEYEEEYFETDNQRELRQIFSGQSRMFNILSELNRKLDEIVGKQERTLSLISQVQVDVTHTEVTGKGEGYRPIDTIRRQEVDAVLSSQNIIINTVQEIRSFVGEMNSKTDTIINNQARAPTAQVQPMGYDYQSLISEMRDGLNTLKRDMAQTNAKLTTPDCPTANCLTTTMFLLFVAIQMILLLTYSVYRDNKEAQAKKFY